MYIVKFTRMYIVLPTLPLLRRPSGPSDPTGSGSGGFNPALAWGLTAPCGSGACSGPRERVGPPATTSNRFSPGNRVTRSTFSPSPFPLFDFQVRVAAAERGCVSEIRKKIRKYKIQKHLGKARRPTVYQRQLLRSYPAFSGSGLPVEQASSSQLWTPNAPLSTKPLTNTVFVQLTPLTHFFHF